MEEHQKWPVDEEGKRRGRMKAADIGGGEKNWALEFLGRKESSTLGLTHSMLDEASAVWEHIIWI